MVKIELIGNLGADAEIMESNGSKFIVFRVADTQKYKDSQGNEVRQTTWFDCTMNDPDSKVFPYLKQGVKVFVRGNMTMRVFSSKQEKRMKAGCNVAVREVELCGGQSEDVPRELVDPSDGAVYPVSKHYWCQRATKGMKSGDVYELVDTKGNSYTQDKTGFVKPVLPEPEQEESEQSNNSTADQK